MALVSTALTQRGVRGEFYHSYKSVTPIWPTVSTNIQSDKDVERYAFLGALDKPREWVGPRLSSEPISETWDVVNKLYEHTLQIARTEFEDDQTGQIQRRVAEFAQMAARHKDILLADLLANGGADLCYDTQPFFSGTHSSGDSGNQDNDRTTNIGTPTAPNAAEMSAAIEEAITTMMGFKDEKGNAMWMDASGLTLIVPTGLSFRAMEAVNSTLIANVIDAARAAAQDNVLKGACDVVVLPHLSAQDVFYLVKNNEPSIGPFIHQQRTALEFAQKDAPTDEGVFNQDVYTYGTRERFRLAYGRWQYCLRHVFT